MSHVSAISKEVRLLLHVLVEVVGRYVAGVGELAGRGLKFYRTGQGELTFDRLFFNLG